MKKSLFFAAFLGSALLLGACGESEKKIELKADEEKEIEAVESNLKEQGAVDKSETAKSDDDLKEEFGKEEGVNSVGIIVTEDSGGYVLLDFNVAEDVKEDKAKELSEKFAGKLKAKYADYQIDVQAHKNGEMFVEKAIE